MAFKSVIPRIIGGSDRFQRQGGRVTVRIYILASKPDNENTAVRLFCSRSMTGSALQGNLGLGVCGSNDANRNPSLEGQPM